MSINPCIAMMEGIGVIAKLVGVKMGRGYLEMTGRQLGEKLAAGEVYQSYEQYLEMSQEGETALGRFEGRGNIEVTDGVWSLKRCPFKGIVMGYLEDMGELPGNLKEVIQEENQRGGAAVSIFCPLHQNIRRHICLNTRVGDGCLEVTQLGCRSYNGGVFISEENARAAGIDPKDVDALLKDRACVYSVGAE
jgi:hypothetical protein